MKAYKDKFGDIWWVDGGGRLFLRTKIKPISGKWVRNIGHVSGGVLTVRSLQWHYKNGCWYIGLAPLVIPAFKIRFIHVIAKCGRDKKVHHGYVHRLMVAKHRDFYHQRWAGYELQKPIHLSDLKKTPEKALEEYRAVMRVRRSIDEWNRQEEERLEELRKLHSY